MVYSFNLDTFSRKRDTNIKLRKRSITIYNFSLLVWWESVMNPPPEWQ